MSSRQQIRQQERALAKRGEAAISAGLPQTPQKDDIVAVAFVLGRTLRDQKEPRRASRAAAEMHALTEASTRRTPGTAKLACSKGCGYCCHTWVGATAPEVLLLAGGIRADAARRPSLVKPGLIDDIVARSRPLAGLSAAKRFGAKLPCPLLVDGACSRYRERPAMCRQATSLDLSGCLEEFEGKGLGGAIPVSAVYLAHTRNSRVPLIAALRLSGLDARTYELSAGLARALETENAETRWLAGENVFAGVAQGAPEVAPAEQAIGEILRELAAPRPAAR